jgi:hypothetical protein
MYQIRIYKKGKIEIFQNVESHRMRTEGVLTMCIEYNDHKNGKAGVMSVAHRTVDDAYKIETVENPQYEFNSSFPKETKIIING